MKRLLSLFLALMMLIPSAFLDVPTVAAETVADKPVSNVEVEEPVSDSAEPVVEAEKTVSDSAETDAVKSDTEAEELVMPSTEECHECEASVDLVEKEDKPTDSRGGSLYNFQQLFPNDYNSDSRLEGRELKNLVSQQSVFNCGVTPHKYAGVTAEGHALSLLMTYVNNGCPAIVLSPNPPDGDYSVVTGSDNSFTSPNGNYIVNTDKQNPFINGWKIPGYTFSHWKTDNSLKPSVDPVEIYQGTKMGTNSDNEVTDIIPLSQIALFEPHGFLIILHAQWNPITYRVELDPNGASGMSHSVNHNGQYDLKYGVEYDLTKYKNYYSRYGYKLLGWSLNKDDSTELFVNSFKNLTTIDGERLTLYAQWKQMSNRYNIVFRGNGATAGEMDSITGIAYSQFVTLPANEFVRNGYSFAGWNTKADGTGTAYPDEALVQSLSESNGNVYLYAQWNPTEYVIRYDANGGTMKNTVSPSDTYEYGETVTLQSSSIVTRYGYNFQGWNTKSDGTGRLYAAGSQATNIEGWQTGSVTLYAMWVKGSSSYTIIFRKNADDADGDPYEQIVDMGEPTYLKNNTFTRYGYNFDHWNTKSDDSGKTYSNRAQLYGNQITTVDGATVSLYAQWTPKTVYVTWNNNYSQTGGTSSNYSGWINVARKFGATYGGFSPSSAPSGYIFAGWKTEDGEWVQSFSLIRKAESHTLYAQWQQTSAGYLRANIYPNGGEWPNSNGSTGSVYYLGVQYSSKQIELPVKTGCALTGWAYSADGTSTIPSSDSYTKINGNTLTFGGGKSVVNPANLYAQWEPLQYSVRYNHNGGSTTTSMTTGIIYNSPGSTPQRAKGITTFRRTGYHIVSWNSKPDGSGTTFIPGQSRIDTIADAPHRGIYDLYAQWELNTYTIEFVAGIGGEGTMPSMTCTYGQKYSLSNCTFTCMDYEVGAYLVFDYWLDEDNAATYVDGQEIENLTTVNNGTVTLEANWRQIINIIRVDGNGGTATVDGETAGYIEKTVNFDDLYRLPSATFFTRTGYAFSHFLATYNNRQYGAGQGVYQLVEEDGFVVIFKAIWITAYTIKFDIMGADNGREPEDIECIYGQSYRLPKAKDNQLEKYGYTFLGWNTDPGYEGYRYSENQYVSNLTAEPGGIYTFYAEWEVVPFTVRFEANYDGAPNEYIEITNYDKDYYKLPADTFEKTGYKLTSWYSPEYGEYFSVNTTVSGLAYMAYDYGDMVTFVAQWTPIEYRVVFATILPSPAFVAAQDFVYDVPQRLIPNPITTPPVGMVFDCWETTIDDEVFYFEDEAEVLNLSYEPDFWSSTRLFWAQWKPGKYKVTFDNQEATTSGTEAFWYYYNTVTDGVYYYFDEECTEPVPNYTITVPTKTGYIFSGYYTEPKGKGTQYIADTGTAINDIYGAVPNDSTLYAYWTPRADTTYEVVHWQQKVKATQDQNETNYTKMLTQSFTGTTGTKVTPEVMSYIGFTSPGRKTVTIAGDGTTVVNYYYTRNSYTLTVNPSKGLLNGSNLGYSISLIYGDTLVIEQPILAQHKFDGWQVQGNGSSFNERTNTFTMGYQNATLTANWSLNEYIIHFKDGSDLSMPPLTRMNTETGRLEEIESLVLPARTKQYTFKEEVFKDDFDTTYYPEKEGHIFTGWYTSQRGAYENNKSYALGQNDVISRSVYTLYAGFIKIEDNLTVVQDDPGFNNSVYQGNNPNEGRSEFEMYGVQVRTVGPHPEVQYSDNGLRFMMRVSKNLLGNLSALNGTAKYGFISGKKNILDAYNAGGKDRNVMLSHNQVVTAAGNKYSKQESKRNFLETDSYYVYTCVITGFDYTTLSPATFRSRMETDLVVRPYIEYVDANGTTRTYYQTDELVGNSSTKIRTAGGAYIANLKYVSEFILSKTKIVETVKSRLFDYYLQPYYSTTVEGIDEMTWDTFKEELETIIVENSYIGVGDL